METINKHLLCSICLETFKDPKTLPCLHNFCQHCLQEHISRVNVSGAVKLNCFECPLCRRTTYPVNRQTKRDCWASDFLTNHFIVSLTGESKNDSSPSRNSESKRKEQTCVPCKLDGKQEVSSCFCISCYEYLCRACQKDHARFKMTRKHVVIDENEYPNNTEILTEFPNLIQCKVHSNHEVQFQCLVHNAFICSVCTTTIHKECENMLNIDNLNPDNSSDFDLNISKLTSLKESLNAVIASTFAEAERLDTNLPSVDSNITVLREAIEDMVRFLQCDLLPKYNDKAKLEKNEISSHIVQCLAAINALSRANYIAKSLLQYDLAEQQVVYVESLHDKVETIKLCLKKLSSAHNDDASTMIKDNMLVLKTMILEWTNKLCCLELGIKSQKTYVKHQG